MDRRLTTAAQTGNVEFLFKLIEDDPLILHSVALAGGDTPLHIASMAGHLNFVQTIMNLREEFARELNQDGFSPLHIASANGYVEIVKELLRVDHNLCLFKGRERRIPLHYAALKGRVDVIKELLAASSQSVEEVTARGETALHLAVKNNQFDVLTILVEHLKHFKNEFVLNAKDEQGNTILHLAVCRKQYEVVESLLGENSVSKAVEEVNSLNNNGLTALDVLLLFQSEAGDREIEEILRRAGAMRARDLLTLAHASSSLNQNVAVNSSNDRSMPEQDLSSDEQLVDYLRFNKERDSPSDVRDTILVIAVLIFAATYEAGFSPPGGLWQEDSTSHIAGRSVLATKRLYSYAFFLICNSIGLLASASVILTFAKGLPSEFGLRRAIAALSVTYGICLAVTAPDGYSIWIILSCSIAIPLIVLYGTTLARYYYLRWWKNTVQSRSQQSA